MNANGAVEATQDRPPVSFREAFRVWLKIGLLSFGGPAGQISLMHRLLVDERRWISEQRFLHALNYCMLLPGPEAQQLAIYVGWLLHGTLGGVVAGVLFVLPGFFVILALSVLYAGFQDLSLVQAIFFGIKAAVLAVVIEAVHRIGRRALKSPLMVTLAAIAFVGIFFFNVPFPFIVLGAGLFGLLGSWLAPERFRIPHHATRPANHHDHAGADAPVGQSNPPAWKRHSRSLRVLAVCLALWLGPIGLFALLLGGAHIYVQEAIFFSKMAVVTFGGAYAVLAYVAQEAVEHYGWLVSGEMLDGLGLAETTPGPLIMVVQFVGFLGAYRAAGALDPMLAGTLGAVVTTWVTFVPCFLWVLLGAPYVEKLRDQQILNAGLSAITAAVVGVILNLALWFSLHVLFGEVNELSRFGLRVFLPVWHTVDWPALALAAGALVALLRFKTGILPTLAWSTALGMLFHLAR